MTETPRGVALVTGATGSIGGEICRRLSASGYRVAAHAHSNIGKAEELARECGTGSFPFIADLTDPLAAGRLVREVEAQFGAVPFALVHAAGVPAGDGCVSTVNDDDVARHLQGFHMQVSLCRAIAQRFTAVGAAGRIVLLSGALGQRVFPGLGVYAGMCAATNALARTLALEVGASGTTVNVIAPGKVDAGQGEDSSANDVYTRLEQVSAQRTALARPTTPTDIADLTAHLLGPGAQAITGQIIHLAQGEPL